MSQSTKLMSDRDAAQVISITSNTVTVASVPSTFTGASTYDFVKANPGFECSAIANTGSGGGAGGYVDAIIYSPSITYAYSIGSGGTGGAAGTSGTAGGAGGSGFIIVTEFYQ